MADKFSSDETLDNSFDPIMEGIRINRIQSFYGIVIVLFLCDIRHLLRKQKLYIIKKIYNSCINVFTYVYVCACRKCPHARILRILDLMSNAIYSQVLTNFTKHQVDVYVNYDCINNFVSVIYMKYSDN